MFVNSARVKSSFSSATDHWNGVLNLNCPGINKISQCAVRLGQTSNERGRRPLQSSHSALGALHRQWSTSAETCEGRGYHYRALHGGLARACKRHGSAARKLHLQGLVGTCGRWRRRPAGGGGVQWLPFKMTAVALRRWQLERHRTLARRL